MKMTGIYLIKSPTGKVYIGQSRDVKKRWIYYKSTLAIQHPHLNNSFKKYGFDSHELKILHELPNDIEQKCLNEYECFYIDQYRDCGFVLMNCREGGSNGRLHPDVIERIRQKNIGKKRNGETKLKISQSLKGMQRTEEWCNNISLAKKGKPSTFLGKKFPADAVNKMKIRVSDWHKNNSEISSRLIAHLAKANSRPVIQLTKTGQLIKEWKSAREVERSLGIAATSIAASIRGVRCKHAGGFKWQYKNQ